MATRQAMHIAFRPAHTRDFDYCASLYFAGMETTIRDLKLDRIAQAAGLRQQWDVTQVRIITFGDDDIGWLQSATRGDDFFLAQLFVDGGFQGRGIGTEVMRRLIAEAAQTGRGMTLSVVKSNPALRLYQRLGFHITDEDDRKFHMRRDPGTGLNLS
jgi:ribosomal protein S18 acetylase RimI-like enzyme